MEKYVLIRLDLRQIRYFLALYQEHSITRAANRLNVVQPAVSMQIRRLEGDYGVELFDRTSSGVFPNRIADNLYEKFSRIMEEAEAAHQYLLTATGKVSGELRVGIPPSIAFGPAHAFLLRYQRDFPEVSVHLSEGYSSNLVEWLLNNELDFAVLSTEHGNARLIENPLVEEALVAIWSGDIEIDVSEGVSLECIADLDLVLPSKRNLLRALIDEHFASNGHNLIPKLEVDSFSVVARIVQNGNFATILPKTCAQEIVAGTSLLSAPLNPMLSRRLVAAYPSNRTMSPAAEAFVDVLANELSEYQFGVDG